MIIRKKWKKCNLSLSSHILNVNGYYKVKKIDQKQVFWKQWFQKLRSKAEPNSEKWDFGPNDNPALALAAQCHGAPGKGKKKNRQN